VATTSRRHAVEAALLQLVHLSPGPLPQLTSAEWAAVQQLATRERVGPLAFRALERADAEVPDSIRSALRSSYEQAAAAAETIYRQVADLQRLLRGAGIRAPLFKGAALARFTYGDEGLRPFSDIDLLTRREDVAAVHRLLRQTGYAIVGDAPTEADLTWRHGRAYYDPQATRVPVDVHWRYLGYPLQVALDYERIFERVSEAPVNGELVTILSPGDHLVATGVAFLRELWYGKPRLRYLRDLAEIARRPGVDWSPVLLTAEETPLLRTPIRIVLAAAVQVLGAPVPAALAAALRPPRGSASGILLARTNRTLLRREHPAAAILQVGTMRWLDGGPAGLIDWLRSLLFIPAPLAGGRRRWLRHLWEG